VAQTPRYFELRVVVVFRKYIIIVISVGDENGRYIRVLGELRNAYIVIVGKRRLKREL
jgi:hypothetical protein